jgi:hypothetical protein
MRWARWVTERVQGHDSTLLTVGTNTAAAAQQAASAHTKVATVVEKTAAMEAVNPSLPLGPPQVPSAPTLATDHGTVTIYWDGLVHANQSYTPQAGDDNGPLVTPAIGFNHVSASRATSADGPWSPVGGFIRAAGSLVDTDVVVGQTYFYYFETTDNAKVVSDPSESASIVVKGVDLGSLDSDVKDAINAATDAAAAGQDAAAAGKAAADAAAQAAQSAAAQAAQALLSANNAVTAANGKNRIIYSTLTPTAQSGSGNTGTGNTGNSSDGDNGNGTWTRSDFTDNNDGTWTATANITDNGDGTWTAGPVTSVGVSGSGSTSGSDAYIDGDMWLQIDATGTIIAEWIYTAGSWVTQTLSGTIIGSGINAGNITTGTISANRIAANSISASQMIAGTITAASGILADAVITTAKIADLAVSTAKIADLAVNDAKIATLNATKILAGTITADKMGANSVTTNSIVAGAVDTNRIAAGAITADKMTLGTVSNASPTDRVPQPLTNDTFWGPALGSTIVFNGYAQGAAYLTGSNNSYYGPGLTVNNSGYAFITQQLPVPGSRKLVLSGTTNDGQGAFVVREFSGPTQFYDTAIGVSTTGNPFTFRPDSLTYYVYIGANNGNGYQVYTSAHVFEVIGNAGNGQSAQLSPAGLQLFDVNGALAVDLTTNAQQYLTINDNTGSDPRAVAAIDQSGNAAFSEISATSGVDILGVPLTDINDPYSLINSTPNGANWQDSLLDRLARGVIYDVTWPSLNEYTIGAAYNSLRIAQDSFILEDGRNYMIDLQSGGLQLDATTDGDFQNSTGKTLGGNMYLELQLSLTPITDISTGVNVSRGIVYNLTRGTFVTQSPIFSASANQSSIDNQGRLLPANVPIYWQLDISAAQTLNRGWKLNEFGYSRGLSVIDMGSSNLNRPNTGADPLANVSSRVQTTSTGSNPAGAGSTGTSAKSTTKTYTATWSRTWNQAGANQVTGSGQYTNGSAMYQGLGASGMSAQFGFADLGLSGKTITNMQLYMKNAYFAYSGRQALLGTHGNASPPATYTASRSNAWNPSWSGGQGKWVTVPKNLWGGFANGTYRGFSLGPNSDPANYAYFNGATQSSPPQIKITYH